ncbi:DUF5652 family protein [Aquihabitans sp. McL0605]|uniref:DUF5652 family protein n=1 Tax=Aquihabitans sp. McL0605 TaxID=3415671 RepID=UPI003CF1AC76
MPAKRWNELSPRTRKLVVVGATVDAVLRIAALVDLARRPAAEVRGSKRRWVLAVTLLNSVGVVPIAYFLRGRRPQPA